MPLTELTPDTACEALARSGVGPNGLLALAVVPGAGVALATRSQSWSVADADVGRVLAAVATELGPRWVWWSAHRTAASLVARGVRPRTCWDLAAVHRVLHGGRRDAPDRVWAVTNGLPTDGLPRSGQLTLLGWDAPGEDQSDSPPDAEGGDVDHPVRPDGYLRPEWADEPWAQGGGATANRRAGAGRSLERAARWAALALDVQSAQARLLMTLPDGRPAPRPPALAMLTAYAESAAALLAVELAADGLPLDRAVAETVIAGFVGGRPADAHDEAQARARRDDLVLRHLPEGTRYDLRNPAQVRELLRRIGIDVPDTRSWRLEAYRGTHPAVEALLTWRKAERVATTYGYGWMDRHVGADGRLRGAWSASDGAAGRMTAQAGLHNLPADFRVAVAAEHGHVLVRADLGQIEPRVLAAVSGDPALAAATLADDLYAPVAAELRCDRPTAKVAVLAAMYGQTSGAAGVALRRMDRAYPRAMRFLRAADEAGQAGLDVRTHGGRRVTMYRLGAEDPAAAGRAAVAGRGRFARNAVVQGAAAELFKAWAASVRTGLLRLDGRIVLCLHDELLLHVPTGLADPTVELLRRTLATTAATWAAGSGVRFVADVAVVRRWADAKG